jgi:hypothetical protein
MRPPIIFPFKKPTVIGVADLTMGAYGEGIPLSGTPPGLYRKSMYMPTSEEDGEEKLEGEEEAFTANENVSERLVTPEADSSAPIQVDFQSLLLPASSPYAATPSLPPATSAPYPYPSYPPPVYGNPSMAYGGNPHLMPYANATTTQGSATSFPEKLHQILNLAEYEGWMDVVSFAPHGRAFCIHEVRAD